MSALTQAIAAADTALDAAIQAKIDAALVGAKAYVDQQIAALGTGLDATQVDNRIADALQALTLAIQTPGP